MVNEAGVPVSNPTSADSVFVKGFGQPGDTISVFQNGHLEGSVTVDMNGGWKFQLSPLSSATYYDVTATETTKNGDTSPLSNHFGFNSGYVPVEPVSPVLPWTPLQPSVPVEPVQPQPSPVSPPYISGMVNEAGVPVSNPIPADSVFVKGFGQPGDTINVFQNGHLEGSVTVDMNGGWKFQLSPLSSATYYDVTATETAKNGDTSPLSNHFGFNSGYVPVEPVDVHPDQPLNPVEPVNPDPSLPPAPVVFGVVNEAGVRDWDVSHPQFLKGLGEAGDTINVFLNGHLEGTTTVDSNGAWQFHLTGLVGDTYYDVKVTETAESGLTSNRSNSYGFTVYDLTALVNPDQPVDPVNPVEPVNPVNPVNPDLPLPSAPGILGVVNEAGVRDWDVSHPQFLKGFGEAGDTINVFLNGHLEGTTTADTNGAWQFHLTGLVADTYYDVKVTETAQNGQTSHESSSYGFTVYDVAAFEPVVPPEHEPIVVYGLGAFTAANDAGDTVITVIDASDYFKSATAHIQGGHGVDTLIIGGDHNVLNLDSISGPTMYSKLSSVEVIDLHNAHNSLQL